MFKPSTTKYERETIIHWNDEEQLAFIYTASPVMYRRMIARGYIPVREDSHGAFFEVPKKAIRPVRAANAPKRVTQSAEKGVPTPKIMAPRAV